MFVEILRRDNGDFVNKPTSPAQDIDKLKLYKPWLRGIDKFCNLHG